MAEMLRREIALRCSPEHAFAVFTEQVDLWWPRGHRKSHQSTLRFEPGSDGRLIERAPDGSEWTMAAVTSFDPPGRLDLDWFPGSPAVPTRVAISFSSRGEETVVTIVHQPLSAEAEAIWAQRVAQFGTGWDNVLTALRFFIDAPHDGNPNAEEPKGG
jgi:hypothetical protein